MEIVKAVLPGTEAHSGTLHQTAPSKPNESGQFTPDLARIHRIGPTDPSRIRSLLELARSQSTTFESGLGRQLDREQAWIDSIESDSLWLRTRNFDLDRRNYVALTFTFDGDTYLMNSALLDADSGSRRIRISQPRALYQVERRERERCRPGGLLNIPSRANVRWRQVVVSDAEVIDYSHDGVALKLPALKSPSLGGQVELHFTDGPEVESVQTGWVRRSEQKEGWQQVGLSITAAPPGRLLPVERRGTVLPRSSTAALRNRLQILRGTLGIAIKRGMERVGFSSASSIGLDLVRFDNAHGEQIVALCDSWRAVPGTPVVIMPPAWAKTKETLLPLARTIVATFRRADRPIAVLRLDGIRRRGESFNDPECRMPGRECHHMTFSQGVADIQATLDFVERSPQFRASKIVLVTFSGASIEARKVIASEVNDRICGWVSVVGAADLKSGLRTVSGGLDYIGGCERGVTFGTQRVLGIETNADLVCRDALDHELAHLEDARRQMARIKSPITWIQGRHDAWIDANRVREILSCGDPSKRRLIETPTGHQLRTSREALDTFQLVASEIGRFVTGKPLDPALPDLASLELRRRAERQRLPSSNIDLKQFWRDYILGRDGHLGMDLLTATSPYWALMSAQVDALKLRRGYRIADLGAGTGTLPRFLQTELRYESCVEIHEVDCLREVLDVARRRLDPTAATPRVLYLACDMTLDGPTRHVPMKTASYDAVFASLLLNYVGQPKRLLAEARRLIRPGGRLVVSVLRKDTDISQIYQESARELRSGTACAEFERVDTEELEESVRSFLNEASRLLDLEEQGHFHFWEPEELESLVLSAGFSSPELEFSFGSPPQAIIVSATVR